MNELIQSLVQKSAFKGLCTHEEKTLLMYLKSLDEANACEALKYMVDQRSLVAPLMAKKVLHTKTNVIKMFEYSLKSSKIHNIKLWLEFSIHKLGMRTAVKILKDLDDENNKLIEKALYWLPQLISYDDQKSQEVMDQLVEQLSSKRTS